MHPTRSMFADRGVMPRQQTQRRRSCGQDLLTSLPRILHAIRASQTCSSRQVLPQSLRALLPWKPPQLVCTRLVQFDDASASAPYCFAKQNETLASDWRDTQFTKRIEQCLRIQCVLLDVHFNTIIWVIRCTSLYAPCSLQQANKPSLPIPPPAIDK